MKKIKEDVAVRGEITGMGDVTSGELTNNLLDSKKQTFKKYAEYLNSLSNVTNVSIGEADAPTDTGDTQAPSNEETYEVTGRLNKEAIILFNTDKTESELSDFTDDEIKATYKKIEDAEIKSISNAEIDVETSDDEAEANIDLKTTDIDTNKTVEDNK